MCMTRRSDVCLERGSVLTRHVTRLRLSARTKVCRYRETYATRQGVTYAFLSCVMSTSCRIHGEFLRFLYILAHCRTKREQGLTL